MQRTLTMYQSHQVIKWIEANHTAFTHSSYVDVAKAVTHSVGFDVTDGALRRICKQIMVAFAVPVPKQKTLEDRVAALEKQLAKLSTDLYGTNPAQRIIPVTDSEWGAPTRQ